MRYFHIMNDKKEKKVQFNYVSLCGFYDQTLKKKLAQQYCFLKEPFKKKINMLKPSFRN